MRSLTVVLPAFNEESAIAGVLERIAAMRVALAGIGLVLDVLVVDDGSRDGTAVRAAQCAGVSVVKHRANAGYGAALKTGFRHARGDFIAFLDADGTYPPEALPSLCQPLVADQADLVVGSRMSGERSAMPRVRWIGNAAYARLLSAISRVRIRDTASGMRVFRRSILPRLYPLPDGLEFTPAMSTRAVHEHLRMCEVPIPYDGRVGESKLSVVGDGLRFTRVIVWTALSYNPVRVLGVVSLALIGLAVLIVGWVALLWAGGSPVAAGHGHALAAAAVMGATGVSLFSLGAMFNYLVSLFHERPVRQGLFGRPLFVPPLDHHFGWIGASAVGAGLVMASATFVGSLGGWQARWSWMVLLVASLLVIVGVQLSIGWIVMRVLEELAQRETSAARDRDASQVEWEAIGGR
ncbi:MAG: glycosyltransferase family 2 protein [Vicinamibacterales bacterium]